jgi:glycosyltransferase involved in cell wall biosynthesis
MADDLTPKTVAARGDGHAIDVSVIIPTYNGAATIRRAVETALEADGVEVIVADDGSTDETPTVLEQLQAAHGARLTVVTLPENCGQVEAQNAALDAACGTWILFIGDDDWIDPDGLREMVARANEAGDGVGFVYGAMQYHGMRDDIVRPKRYNRAQFTRHFPAGVSCIWRREIAAAHGIRYRAFGDNKTGQPSDFDLILQIIKAGYDGLAVPDVLVCHHTLAGDRGTAWLHANQDAGLLARFREEHPEFVGRL